MADEAQAPARVAWAVDTESTGMTEPQVIQFAYAEIVAKPGPLFEVQQTTLQQFKPTKVIELGALAAHNIIPSDLESFPPPPEHFELPKFIIGHNIDYDWGVLGSQQQVYRIDTLALAREAWPGLDSYKLGALIYHLNPPAEAREMLKSAHSAVADLAFCYTVFIAAIAAITVDPPIASWGDVWRLSEHARIPKIMPIDKRYKGRPIAEVPRDFAEWYVRLPNADPYLIQAFRNAGLLPQEQAA